MNFEGKIPVIVGITGHRNLRSEDKSALLKAVKAELEKIQKLCPKSPVVMLTSLAEGADTLCADAAVELNIPVFAALPRDEKDYEKDFSNEPLERLKHHCINAAEVFVVPDGKDIPPEGVNRDYQFRNAGRFVAQHSHVLIALWDGKEGLSGCGTAEAVSFADNVIHVFSPRMNDPDTENIGDVHYIGNREDLEDALVKTDEFNALAENNQGDSELEKISRSAGNLSRSNAKKFRTTLKLMAIFEAMLMLAFLLYDEANALNMVFICGAMLLSLMLCLWYASKTDCHRRYIEYRALAESIRVQINLCRAASNIEAASFMTWSQKQETLWIYLALRALCAIPCNIPKQDIRECWVENQLNYHKNAKKRASRADINSGRIIKTALVISIAVYLVALILEICVNREVASFADHAGSFRQILKIVLGCASVITLLITDYFGHLSLPRKLSDHEKMEKFYAEMSERLLREGQTDELLELIAREELIENGNWCSYQRDNKPEINI